MERKITVVLSEAEADALWTFADMAGDREDLDWIPLSSYKAGKRAMSKLKQAGQA